MIELNAEDLKAVVGGAKQPAYTDEATKKVPGVEARKEAKKEAKKKVAQKRDKALKAQI